MWLVSLLSLIGSLLLMLSAGAKIIHPFSRYEIPIFHINIPAFLIGFYEFAVSMIWLLVTTFGSLLSGVTFLGLGVIAFGLKREKLDCNCFGSARVPVTNLHITLNFLIAVLAFLSGVLKHSIFYVFWNFRISNGSLIASHLVEILFLIAGTLLLYCLYQTVPSVYYERLRLRELK